MRYERSEHILMYSSIMIAVLILFLPALIWRSAGTACHAATQIRSPAGDQSAPNPPSLSEFVAGVVMRSADLTYITEQDSEVFAFYRNTPVRGKLTETVFLGLLRRPEQTPIFSQSWSAFFQIRTQNDPTGRWLDLQEYLEANLTDPTIFRVPRAAPHAVQYDLFAVGTFNGERVVGVQMFGVAT